MEEPTTFTDRIHRMIKLGLSIEDDSTDETVEPKSCDKCSPETKMEEVD